jgi:hypothetical protein
MFASLWALLVRRWRHPGANSVRKYGAPGGQPRPSVRKSRPQSGRKSAPKARLRASDAQPLKSTARRPMRITQIIQDNARAAAGGRHSASAATSISRPTAPASSKRRTAPARHVWLEDRQATAARPGQVIALAPRAARESVRQAPTKAAA